MIKDIVKLNIPKSPGYISLVRLTTSGIAHNIGLNVEDIEDMKVAIGEACINSLTLSDSEEIILIYEVKKDKLIIQVNNVRELALSELDQYKELELGLLIIKSLMDEVCFNEFGIEMTKYIEDDSQ